MTVVDFLDDGTKGVENGGNCAFSYRDVWEMICASSRPGNASLLANV